MFAVMGAKDKNTVQVTEVASDALTRVNQSTKLPKKELVEIVFCWLASQEPDTTRSVLDFMRGPPPELREPMRRFLIERLTSKPNARKVG